MVHESTAADRWYHDAITPTQILGSWLVVLRDHDLSEEERKIIIDKCLLQVDKNRTIIYEKYLEDRRNGQNEKVVDLGFL